MFHGLVKLESLSLYSNKISCVTPGAFDALVSLKSLNLIANPFNCNCHMAWFADWLRIKGFTSGGPRCAHPQHLKDRPIYALANHDFRCTGNCWNVFQRIWNLIPVTFFLSLSNYRIVISYNYQFKSRIQYMIKYFLIKYLKTVKVILK